MHTITWSSPEIQEPRAAVLQISGYNAYMGNGHDYLASRLVDMGIRVYGIDVPGFGRSAAPQTSNVRPDERSFSGTCVRRKLRRKLCHYERRGYVPCFSSLVDDIHDFIEYIHHDLESIASSSVEGTQKKKTASNPKSPLTASRGSKSPNHPIPLFLIGESMGGALTLETIRTSPPGAVSGCVLLAPMCGIDASLTPHPILQAIGKAIAYMAPWMPAPVPDFSHLAIRDKENFESPNKDPLKHHGRVMIGTGLQLQSAAAKIGSLAEAGAYSHIPMLVCHGTTDVIVPFFFSQKLVEGAENKAKRLGVIPSNAPTVSNVEDVLADIADAAELKQYSASSPDAQKSMEEHPVVDTTFAIYEDAWHVLFGETLDTRERVICDIVGWILGRLPTEAVATGASDVTEKAELSKKVSADEADLANLYRTETYVSPINSVDGMEKWSPVRRVVRPFGKGDFAPIVVEHTVQEETMEPLLLS